MDKLYFIGVNILNKLYRRKLTLHKPIISVKEARKILGKEAEKMTDNEILKLIDDLDFLASYTIKKFN